MTFIGQTHIIRRLELILPSLKDGSPGISMLFRGPSGYGKTHLCKYIAKLLSRGNDKYTYQLGNSFSVTRNYRVHFIDEIHLCKEPEILYPIMDSKKYVLLFATNYDSLLPEAFQNRCLNFIFTSYSDRQLIAIFKNRCSYDVNKDVIKYIIKISNKNPRIMIENYIRTVELLFQLHPEKMNKISNQDFIELINEIHGIRDELEPNALDYMMVLKGLGGRAAIDMIVNTLHVDKNTVKYEIEPALLSRKLIKISSKGRELC